MIRLNRPGRSGINHSEDLHLQPSKIGGRSTFVLTANATSNQVAVLVFKSTNSAEKDRRFREKAASCCLLKKLTVV
jgi:hypothetical protein